MISERKITLWLGDYTAAKHQISFNYRLDDMRFSCTYWYPGANILKLKNELGEQFFDKLIFHFICFEANKLCSLKPDFLDLGKYEKYWTPELEKIWR